MPPQSPGEGTPCDGSNVHNSSLHSGANEMTQTRMETDTLVSMPTAAALAVGTALTRHDVQAASEAAAQVLEGLAQAGDSEPHFKNYEVRILSYLLIYIL